MINSASKYQVSGIFSRDDNVRYLIPKYQREYTWSRDNWEELLNDIWDSDGNHFIGSIICINTGGDSLKPILELVDGQQRLTTLSLLFCAIYHILESKFLPEDEELLFEVHALKWKLVNKKDGLSKIELSHQNNNYNDYLSVLSELKVGDFDVDVKNKGNRKIYKGYRYFLDRLENFSKDNLLILLEKINETMLVKIEVSSHSDAFILFESLNNRGVPLSAIDLIKNNFLSQIEKQQIMKVESAFTKWNERVIKNLDEYNVQERYLRQYYNAFKVLEEIKVEGETKATRSNVIKIFEELIKRDTQFIFEDLTAKAVVYGALLQPNDSDNTLIKSIEKPLIDLIHVKAAPSYTFLLYLFAIHASKGKDFFGGVVGFLVKYFVRRNLTDFPNTRNLDQIFMDVIAELHYDESKVNIDYIISYFTHKDRFASDTDFEKALRGDLYDTNVDATRFILSKIEEESRTKETYTDFRENDGKKKLVWTIEHIFPEGKNIPVGWIDMIAGGDKDLAEQIQEEYVHKLGNLTLTGFNQSLSNFEFSKKRDRTDSKGKPIGYKNKLFLNEGLADKESWTRDDIVERGEKLLKIAIRIFKVTS